MKLTIFKKKQPSVKVVQTEISNLTAERQALQAEATDIENQITAGYGTDINTDSLIQRAYEIEFKSRAYSKVSQELDTALTDAKRREKLGDFESLCKSTSKAIDDINASKETLETLYKQWIEAYESDKAKRLDIINAQHQLDRYYTTVDNTEHRGITNDLVGIRSNYPNLDHAIGEDYFIATRAFKSVGINNE